MKTTAVVMSLFVLMITFSHVSTEVDSQTPVSVKKKFPSDDQGDGDGDNLSSKIDEKLV